MNPFETAPQNAQRGRNMLKTILRSGWALALVAGLLAPGVAAMAQTTQTVQPRKPRAVPALHDGVVVDAAAGVAYVMSREGGIDALDLTSGNVLWKNRDAAKPLALVEGTLVAQARPDRNGALALVMLDARKGNAKGRADVQIPAGLRANVVDGPSQSFQVKAFATAADSVAVTWTAENDIPQGFLATAPEAPQADAATAKRVAAAREEAEAARQPLRGAARLDLKAGRAVAMSYEEAEQARPLVVDIAAEAKAAGGARRFTSLDGRHILRSEPSPEATLWTPYRWTVTTASGARVGTLDAAVSMAPFVVHGSKILYVAQPSARKEEGKIVEAPLRLVAFDLRTGAELWTKAFVDSVYRGPFPP
jgi:hypothetical protein